MYELSFKSAANASLKEIQETRQSILDLLKSQMGGYDPEKKNKKKLIKAIDESSDYEYGRLQVYVELYNQIKSGLNVIIEVDKLKDDAIKLDQVRSLLKKATELELPLNLYVSGFSQFGQETEHVDMLFKQELLNTFIALDNFVCSNGHPHIRFMEDPANPEGSWTLPQVISANEEIDAVVNTIKMQNFSPFEAIAYIHYYLTSQFPYKENNDDPISPRSIVGLLNSEDIVCVGYAKFVKAVVDKLNMKGLSAQTIESVIKPNYPKMPVKMVNQFPISGFAHLQNLITIDDPKYGVEGTYMNDACWDTKNDEFVNGKGFGNFMYPITDAFNYSGYSYQQVESLDPYDATKILQSEKITKPRDMDFYKKYAKGSKPIDIEKYEKVIYSVMKKIYPALPNENIKLITNNYMLVSKLVAAAVFAEKATNSFAVAGRQMQGIQNSINNSEIMK